MKNLTGMTYQTEIDATHPENPESGVNELAADAKAMQLVGERHSKRDLVNLVRWLILRKPEGLILNQEAMRNLRKAAM